MIDEMRAGIASHRPALLLAGVGGDSHSVGIITLARHLSAAGYDVLFMGIQNSVESILDRAGMVDAVLVSNMDGHAAYYLEPLGMHPAARLLTTRVPWYLGGNPMLAPSDEAAARLRSLGFRRVYARYVDPDDVLSALASDLGRRPPASPGRVRHVRATPVRSAAASGPTMVVRSAADERELVLAGWRTGDDVRALERNCESLLGGTSLGLRQREAIAAGEVLLHPRCGVAAPEEQAALFDDLAAAGADVLSFQIDSLSRNNDYEGAETALKRFDAGDERYAGLNGFPLINHGPAVARELMRRHRDLPFQVRHSTKDPRLLAEIALAAGISGFEGGALTYNLPYYKDLAPEESLRGWRYVDELSARYTAMTGVPVDREFFGVLTATLVPPSTAIAVNALESVMAAGRGVRSLSVGYAEQGNRVQDVAAMRAMVTVTRAALDRFGLGEATVFPVFHQFMAAFPTDPAKIALMLEGSMATARSCRPVRVMLKTASEPLGIPEGAANVQALVQARAVIDAPDEPLDAELVAGEHELIAHEAWSILDPILEGGLGRIESSIAAAVTAGWIDVPFSPSRYNAGAVIPLRDCTGAVRYASTGSVPLDPVSAAVNAELVALRLRRDGLTVESAVSEDAMRTARGRFDTWPLED
ncbi:MAG: hypothetical protein ACJ74O_18325 [Frankiaceae bacterium]